MSRFPSAFQRQIDNLWTLASSTRTSMGDKHTPLEYLWEDSFQNCTTGRVDKGAGQLIGRLGVRLPLDYQLHEIP
jgi:hypothetical protein